jgi:heterodisulfide reductase subunit A
MSKSVMVVGGGIAGIQAALDLAELGVKVHLVEKQPSIGGRMSQLDKTFPTLDCSSCILTPKMVDVSRNPNIELLTYSEVKEIQGSAGDFQIKILQKPRYIDEKKCTGDGACIQKCPYKGIDSFNRGLGKRKAIYFEFPQAVPLIPVIDTESCMYFKKGICRVCEKFCESNAIDFNQQPKEISINVASIILATGFDLEDPRKKDMYGYGRYSNVYTSLEYERLLSSTGPTGGNLIRRSDNKHPNSIAFIQCVCSRDSLVNFYCSAFCCMASVKEAILTKEHYEKANCTVFYMDIRAFGKGYQEFYDRAINQDNISFIRSKPAKIEEDESSKNLIITYEDTNSNLVKKFEAEMVVLAVGSKMQSVDSMIHLPLDEDKFVKNKDPYENPVATTVEGVFIAGLISGPKDIPDSVIQGSAAAMKASIYALR